MSAKVRWGVLGAARIALRRVIPGMQHGQFSEIAAIASRDLAKAQSAAAEQGIPRAYGSYEELLLDPEIDAVYNPLPNHLHVPWSIKAAEAGKHVLCEKPIALTAAECLLLLHARDRTRVKIGEAFMVRNHPQWLRAEELVRTGAIGHLRVVNTVFSYFSRDPNNVRHVQEWGGGGLYDIGCYPVFTSRFLFAEEPTRVAAVLEYDPDFKVDRLASAILEFPSGHSVFTCSTQLVYYQRSQIFGTTGQVEIEIPFNPPNDRPTIIRLDGSPFELTACDQYTIQGDLFSRAILDNTEVPVPLESSLRNMNVLDALFRAAESGRWESVARA
jgi:predicted dehydrogenase